MISVVIIEDNEVAAGLLREYIESDDICVSAVYSSGEDALERISQGGLPDVFMVDIGLPGISGVEVTRRIKDLYPDAEIIIQTIFEDTGTIIDAIKAGASGYILKASPRDETIRALREVVQGGSFLSGKIARKILVEFNAMETGAGQTDNLDAYSLTPREKEIIEELIRGSSYKEIAALIGISVHTVNNHIRKIYEKMRVHSRGEAVAKALDRRRNMTQDGASHDSD